MPSARLIPLVAVLCGALVIGTAGPAAGQAVRLKENMSAAEFERCGLHKLTTAEIAALEAWIGRLVVGAIDPPRPAGPYAIRSQSAGASGDEIVAFNTSSRKYHCPTCRWARQCTRNCIPLPLSQARERGVPCSTCGGTCR